MTLQEVIYKRRWVDGIKDGSLVSDAAIAEAVAEHVRAAESDAWEKGMADAKLQMLGVKALGTQPLLGGLVEKDIEEKLKEARRIIEHSDEVTPEVGGAAFFLLGEVERLQGCLEAVCDVVSDAAAYGDAVESADILEAVRGQREVRPKVISFNEIQAGDFLRVSFPPRGGMSDNWTIEHSRTSIAYYKHKLDWLTSDGQVLINKQAHCHAKIELLSRLQ